jgi:tRNA G18 (ribose-2'-O)-methylase SpoU
VPVIPVDDAADPRLEDYRNVPDAELIERRGIFVAEGRLVVRRLLEGGRFVTRSVLVTEPARHALAGVLDARPDVPVFVVAQWVINAITGFNIHRGCLAIGERGRPRDVGEVARAAQRLVVLERVANADNVGALIRSAAAFGAGVLLDPASTDPLYRKAIRTSMGAALQVPFARVAPWPDALLTLRDHGYAIVGLAPRATETMEAVASDMAAVTSDMAAVASGFSRKIAILLGHEGEGLSAAALDACTHRARIAIRPDVDSLNVATAGAIALYELARGNGRD